MEEFIYRQARLEDIPFLVDTIIEAEKSGTEILSYTTIFGLSEDEARACVTEMLEEEIDGCELSVSSFLVAEHSGRVVAALSSWVEGAEGISSSELKGNLLSYVLPRESILKAAAVNPVVRKIHMDYLPGTIQKGAGYVIKEFRKRKLFGILTEKMIVHLLKSSPQVTEVYTQVFGCNIPAIKANEKVGFNIVDTIETDDEKVLQYLPSNKKYLMKKTLV
ncbi:MAG: hypothetical protein KAI08_02990 [Bacteroidales bacterium]|nr:hypothetical protein [Bacteroidales bacterium]